MLGLEIAVIKRVAVTVDDGDLQKLVYGRIKARRLGVQNDKVNGFRRQRLPVLFLPFLFFCCFHDGFMMALTVVIDKLCRFGIAVDARPIMFDEVIVKATEDMPSFLVQGPVMLRL